MPHPRPVLRPTDAADASRARVVVTACAETGAEREGLIARAEALAQSLGLACVRWDEAGDGLALCVTPSRLELRLLGAGAPGPVHSDPLAVDGDSPNGRSLRQPFARALGIARARESGRALRVLDATAGLGDDAWLFACLGCEVVAVERHAVVAALLRDGVERAAQRRPEVAARLRVLHADARSLMTDAGAREALSLGSVDVVWLDPMYPHRRKSALERKEMRVLRELVGEDADASELLLPAMSMARRVVVKRPAKGEPLAPVESLAPVHRHLGRATRYDVYVGGAG